MKAKSFDHFSFVFVLSISVALLAGTATFAQTSPFDNPTAIISDDNADGIGFRNGSIIVAPIPFESPALGTGLALGGAYLFKSDRFSDTSSFGLGGFKSSNGSEALAFGINLDWDNDHWNAKLVVADAALNYDLFVAGVPVPLSQSLSAATFSLSYKPRERVSYGGSIGYGTSTVAPNFGLVLPPELDNDLDLRIIRVSGFAEYDTRDESFYPSQGSLASATLSYGRFVDSSISGYSKLVLSGAKYFPVFQDSVIATRIVSCLASDNAPFFDACALGAVDGFRGYVSTEFIDDSLLSLQVEYRARLTKRLGFVAFAGAGSVGDDFGSAVFGDYKTAVGLGLRIRLSQTFPLDYAIDVASNDRGEQVLYISVGQRF